MATSINHKVYHQTYVKMLSLRGYAVESRLFRRVRRLDQEATVMTQLQHVRDLLYIQLESQDN